MVTQVKVVLIVLITAFVVSNAGAQIMESDSTGYTKIFYGTGQVSSEGPMVDGKPDGYWKTYYVEGHLKSEGNRKNFLLDSIWIFYDNDGDTTEVISYNFGKKSGYHYSWEYYFEKNGNDSIKRGYLKSKELYVQGKKEGPSFYFYKEGGVHLQIYYRNNKKHGPGKEFEKDGRLISILEYLNDYEINKERINRYDWNNLKQGVWKEFYPYDKLMLEETYKEGKLHGYVREYDRKGKVIRFEKYENGNLVEEKASITEEDTVSIDLRNEYFENGALKTSGTYRNDLPIGVHREYNQKGNIVNAKLYDDYGVLLGEGIVDEEGRKQDDWVFYFESGAKASEGKYKDNKQIGKWEFFFEDGGTEQKGKYRKGKPHGEWVWYYAKDVLRRQENFDNGKEDGAYEEYNRDGELIAKGEFYEGERNGDWYFRVGDQIEKGAYEEGMKQGVWKHYFLDGTLRYEGNFLQDSKDGKHKLYYPSGKLKTEMNYVSGSREGKWIEYDEYGELLRYIIFRNDTEYKINGVRLNWHNEGED